MTAQTQPTTCNCIKEKPEQIVEGLNKQETYSGSITSARLKDAQIVIVDGELTSRLSTPVELTIRERKTPKKVPLFFNYCPFCGMQYKR